MTRPRLLDLFCGAGGAGAGYDRAGFDVVGVDIHPQPRYPFAFVQADALEFVRMMLEHPEAGWAVDAIHASPPCQAYSSATREPNTHPDLYGPTRELLQRTGLPWIIENVIGAPYASGVVLCGSMFGLRVRRHRNFESSVLMLQGLACDHGGDRPILVAGHGGRKAADYGHSRHVNRDLWPELMGMPWATPAEAAQGVPPAYTEWIGQRLMGVVRSRNAAHIGARDPGPEHRGIGDHDDRGRGPRAVDPAPARARPDRPDRRHIAPVDRRAGRSSGLHDGLDA